MQRAKRGATQEIAKLSQGISDGLTRYQLDWHEFEQHRLELVKDLATHTFKGQTRPNPSATLEVSSGIEPAAGSKALPAAKPARQNTENKTIPILKSGVKGADSEPVFKPMELDCVDDMFLLETTTTYSYDFTKPQPPKNYKVHLLLNKLSLDKRRKHSLSLLAPKFDPYLNSCVLEHADCGALTNQVLKMLEHSNEDFTEVQDLSAIKPILNKLSFPQEWIPEKDL